MEGFYPMFFGIPVSDIKRDVKDGKYILESKGTVSGNIHAQTVVVYGNISGNIKAEEVVLINGECTGNGHLIIDGQFDYEGTFNNNQKNGFGTENILMAQYMKAIL